jgi:hypothetical protein
MEWKSVLWSYIGEVVHLSVTFSDIISNIITQIIKFIFCFVRNYFRIIFSAKESSHNGKSLKACNDQPNEDGISGACSMRELLVPNLSSICWRDATTCETQAQIRMQIHNGPYRNTVLFDAVDWAKLARDSAVAVSCESNDRGARKSFIIKL